MLNMGSLLVESLDYVFIVDKNYKIIYTTRYDAKLFDQSKEEYLLDVLNKDYFEVYPALRKENSSIAQCIETHEIVINKRQEYYDYRGRKFVTNNVTIPLMSKGELMAVVELAMDIDESSDDIKNNDDDRKFNEFVQKLQKDAGLITFDTILTTNDHMKQSIEKAKVLASLPNPTLIYGETGTGKELFAQSIINYTNTPKEKVIIQNCAAVPENLMEAILFGTVKGIYTGAENTKGLFEQADGGVLFLDELNSIPYGVQSKLLRVLQDGTFRPLGGTEDKTVKVKVIGAMNIDPIEAVEKNILRNDLFYRFSSGLINLLPLRERKEDIRYYINYYMDYFGDIYNKQVTGIERSTEKILMKYSWEGNVRELKNTVESMVLALGEDTVLTAESIPKYILERMNQQLGGIDVDIDGQNLHLDTEEVQDKRIAYYDIMENVERQLIQKALKETDGNMKKASEILGIPRETLRYRVRKLEI